MKRLLMYLILLMVTSFSLFIPVGSVFAAAHGSSPDGSTSSSIGSPANGGSPDGSAPSSIGSRMTDPPQKALGCYAGGCYGLDPGTTGCNLSPMTSVGSMSVTNDNQEVIATGQVIHSSKCNTNWAEGTLTTPPGEGFTLFVSISGGGNISCFPGLPTGECSGTGYAGSTGWPAFTNMIGTNSTMACILVYTPAGLVFSSSPGCIVRADSQRTVTLPGSRSVEP